MPNTIPLDSRDEKIKKLSDEIENQKKKFSEDIGALIEKMNAQKLKFSEEVVALENRINAQQLELDMLTDWLPYLTNVVIFSGRFSQGIVEISENYIEIPKPIPPKIEKFLYNCRTLSAEADQCWKQSVKVSKKIEAYVDLCRKLDEYKIG